MERTNSIRLVYDFSRDYIDIFSPEIRHEHIPKILNIYRILAREGSLNPNKFRYLNTPTKIELKLIDYDGTDFKIIPTASNQYYLDKFYIKLLQQNQHEILERKELLREQKGPILDSRVQVA